MRTGPAKAKAEATKPKPTENPKKEKKTKAVREAETEVVTTEKKTTEEALRKQADKAEKARKAAERRAAEKEKKKSAYTIDCTLPVKDKVFQAKELVEYFLNRIKVAGKTKNLGKSVGIACDDGKKIKVNAEIPLAKRYLKYLAKKFLKKQEVRDYLRLVAPNKSSYEFKYFKMESGEQDGLYHIKNLP
eukprot:TRINITY_DN121026_c2_g1_i1.p4 TRINITY_DN121026_c2_g1~~TRINITY_DN121026_c2_g1_i1.p4  ORF type:complete len:189 (+),score=54.68 TRINITY_DN121026_c2_g1_i1:1774-2340(+)